MKKTSTVLTWTLWTPLKFALFTGLIISLFSIVFFLIFNTIAKTQTAYIFSLILGTVIGLFLSLRRLPKTQMDQKSFVAIHNAQIVTLLLTFAVITKFAVRIISNIPTNPLSLAFIALTIITFFYLIGLTFISIYTNYLRIKQLNIPKWKILLSFPFGFDMLWIPGYFLQDKPSQKASTTIKSKWYAKATNWALSNSLNTAYAFIFITVLSLFYSGVTPMLMTFSFALLFGIWALKTGMKNFEKNMPKKYTTLAIIVNIAMIITCVYMYVSMPKSNLSINISDTQISTTQEQAQ
ncbi:MAG: hypothetical protein IKZ34_02920 [Alphaproteobacteria bacterium]|nr:hypothetical protein [Alphaproteobacteria bacterium]